MTRTSKAVVCRQINEPVVVEDVEVEAPRKNEVMIRMQACGVCHTDLSVTNGTLPMPVPIVLGHEACGTVEEVGDGVTELATGDTVIVSWIPMCGKCRYCKMGRPVLCEVGDRAAASLPDGTTRLRDTSGNPLNHLAGVAVMSELATMHVDSAIRIDANVPPTAAALVSCAVMTGVGAVLNTAKVEPGAAVAVFGTGGVGLNVIQGARLAKADTIIAVDLDTVKLDLATSLGATHAINANDGDPVKAIREICGGADYAFECIGLGTVISQAFKSIRKGGTAVVVGIAKPRDSVKLNAFTLPFQEKTLKGSYYGSSKPRDDFPRMLDFYRDGHLELDSLITATYGIEDAPRAFADLERGANARGVIVF